MSTCHQRSREGKQLGVRTIYKQFCLLVADCGNKLRQQTPKVRILTSGQEATDYSHVTMPEGANAL